MQEVQVDRIAMAEDIAKGDLTHTVSILSDKDTLNLEKKLAFS